MNVPLCALYMHYYNSPQSVPLAGLLSLQSANVPEVDILLCQSGCAGPVVV